MEALRIPIHTRNYQKKPKSPTQEIDDFFTLENMIQRNLQFISKCYVIYQIAGKPLTNDESTQAQDTKIDKKLKKIEKVINHLSYM